MNFYAHLVTASWRSSDPVFGLGAMLPDFATMARVRLPEVAPGGLAHGIAFHHAGDREFHRLRLFREQESWTLEHLLERGLRRGPAKGVAHVGVELSLDGALVAVSDAHELYLGAIAAAGEADIDWGDQESASRFGTLVSRLAELGVPSGYADPQVVADRLIRIMEPRSLLRLSDEEAPILRESMPAVHKRVDKASARIMSELRSALASDVDLPNVI